MRNLLKLIINSCWLHFFIIKIYAVLTYPYIAISAFLRTRSIFETKNIQRLKSLKDIHRDKRCFIVGNGPSLKASDLDKIAHELSFGFNNINLIFNKTAWRPTYYVLADQNCYLNLKSIVSKSDFSTKLIGGNCKKYGRKIKNAIYFFTRLSLNPSSPRFSEDAVAGLTDGYTVTYFALQLAAYMGFSEVYLMGMDFKYQNELTANGQILKNNIEKNYFTEDYKKDKKIAYTGKMLSAFNAAQKHASNHGIKVFNATRGGNLEVFPRVDFDEINFRPNK